MKTTTIQPNESKGDAMDTVYRGYQIEWVEEHYSPVCQATVDASYVAIVKRFKLRADSLEGIKAEIDDFLSA